jgi:GNAT superfamily N-acetyltransferase
MTPTDDAAWEAAALTLDRVGSLLIAKCAPLQFSKAETPTQREAVFRLRYQVVIEQGWAKPEDFPNEQECDAYDDDAQLIAFWDGETLAAAMRVVLPSPDRLLPTEAAFGITIEPRGRVVDTGRTVVHPAYRTHRIGLQLMLGLIGACWIEGRAHGFSYPCGIMNEGMIGLYRLRGVFFTVLAEPQLYWGEKRYPLLLDVVKSAPAMSNLYEKQQP